MKNIFINKIYEKLNPVINYWIMDNEKHGYHISIRFYNVDVNIYKKVAILNVQVDGPAIITNSYYSIPLGYRVPTTTDTYYNVSFISFSEGQFDIDDDSWVHDIVEYMDKWVNADKADVEELVD